MTERPGAIGGLLLKLVGYQRAEFDVASRQQEWVLRTQFFAAIGAMATAFIKDDGCLYGFGLSALVFVLASQYFQWQARVVRNVAEEMRRTVLVYHGLGLKLSDTEFADLIGRARSTEHDATSKEDPEWYATSQPPGYARLAEMLEESVYFSQQILSRSARQTWLRLLGLLAVTLIIFLVAIRIENAGTLLRNVQIACAGLTFLLSAEVLGAAHRYMQAASDTRLVASGLQRARGAGFPAGEVTLLFANYNSSVESAPLFSPGLHAKIKDRLNALFSHRRQGTFGT